jgi:hypothetical protein
MDAHYLSPWFSIPNGQTPLGKEVINAAEALSRTAKAMDCSPQF